MTLKEILTTMAQSISDRAKEKNTPFAEAVDALKALTALYATFLKDKGKSEDDPDGFTMADAQATIQEPGHDGEAAVRSHRGRRTTQ